MEAMKAGSEGKRCNEMGWVTFYDSVSGDSMIRASSNSRCWSKGHEDRVLKENYHGEVIRT